MSSADERRKDARFLTAFMVILRSAKGGPPLDERAMAHEVSTAGFKIETHADLTRNSGVAFVLELPEGGCVSGQGLVIWSKREKFATWAGIEIVKMSWADKRRLSRRLHPNAVDWSRIADLAVRALFVITVVVAAQKLIFQRPDVLGVMAHLTPKFIALLLMAWALLGLLKR